MNNIKYAEDEQMTDEKRAYAREYAQEQIDDHMGLQIPLPGNLERDLEIEQHGYSNIKEVE